MTDVIFVIAQNNFQPVELMDTKEALQKKGFSCDIASKTTMKAKATDGMSVMPDISIKDVIGSIDLYKAVVFIGGGGSEQYFDDEEALSLAKISYEKGKVTAAICIAPVILGNAGILEGKKATIWDNEKGEFAKKIEAKGSEHTGNDVEVDGKIVTANGPGAATDFGNKIAELLE
ncbi:MAG: DJ-1/PfpI family protein [Nanoarchaeota archaeon]|nr:DJ-1/PfpI family protein [Nanoarchaeota archaeon]